MESLNLELGLFGCLVWFGLVGWLVGLVWFGFGFGFGFGLTQSKVNPKAKPNHPTKPIQANQPTKPAKDLAGLL